MATLNLGIEIRDFDLERIGFSLSVLNQADKRLVSEAYLRMTLSELNVFLTAIKAASGDIDLTSLEASGMGKAPISKAGRQQEDGGVRPRSEKLIVAE